MMTFKTLRLVAILVVVICVAAYIKLSNPYKKYSTERFWASASIDDVKEIPDEVLLPGNRNGGVLMWASYTTKDPRIIADLIKRGAEVNEEDIIFTGTPLSSAAANSATLAVIDELIKNGAEINKVVGSNDKTPLIIAAELNPNPEIIERLIHHGADINYKDLTGRNALEQAVRFDNYPAVNALKKYYKN